MRILALCCLIALQLALFPLHATELGWIKDSTNGCMIADPHPKSNETVTWSGKCVDGKAEGTGELIWSLNGIPHQTVTLTGENGLSMVAGKVTSKVIQSDVRFELADCKQQFSYYLVNGFVRKELALWNGDIASQIVTSANSFAQSHCSGTLNSLPRGVVKIYYEGDQPQPTHSANENYQIRAGQNYMGQWVIENRAWKSFSDPQEEKYKTLLAERQAELQARQRAASEARERERIEMNRKRAEEYNAKIRNEREQAENARRMERNGYDSFVRKNDVVKFIDMADIDRNPFSLKGKVIATKVSLANSRMIEENKAIVSIFSPKAGYVVRAVVSDVSGDLLTKGNIVIVAGKMLGKTSIKEPLVGDESLPYLQFVDTFYCVTPDCGVGHTP